jgi:hypothetical protein
LSVTDVAGDGNCFYRALSVSIYGHQNEHTALRKSIAQHVLKQSENSTTMDYRALQRRALDIAKDGSWAGEDSILAAANFLQRPIHVYVAAVCSPLIYVPSSPLVCCLPILIAFYEPGHYRSLRPHSTEVISSAVAETAKLSSDHNLNYRGKGVHGQK